VENVAITGLGVISSIGQGIEEFNRSLAASKVVAGPVRWQGEGHKNIWMSLVEGFEPSKWTEDRVVRNSATFSQYALAAAVQAVADAGIETFDPLRTAVVVGSALGGVDTNAEDQCQLDTDGPDAIDSKFMVKSLINMPAAHIALRWGLHGPQLCIATACASSHDAMGIAARMIESGEVDVAITGGTDCAISPLLFFGARNNKMFTPQPDPYKTCRPFNVERFGVMLGEGAGMFVLERADHARKRGATIHGRLRGYATLADGYHPSSPEPEGKWEQRVMELALASAGLPGGADDVDAVVAHGTGTPAGDIAELAALNRIYGNRSNPMRVMSPKGNFGHPHGPAGAMGLLVGLYSMRENALMPTAGTYDERELMPEVDKLHAVIKQPAEGRIAGLQVNAFGFGGQNSSLVVTRE
jgi:3-oxoacyl-[acyl-carrier-protein] synthase II